LAAAKFQPSVASFEQCCNVVSTHPGGGDHGGFVDHDQGAPTDVQLALLDEVHGFGDGQPLVAGAAGDGFVDGLTTTSIAPCANVPTAFWVMSMMVGGS
jgi:hypothetical protein